MLHQADGELASIPKALWRKLKRRADLLRSAKGVLSEKQARRIAGQLDTHWVTVYRWHERFVSTQSVTALAPRAVGFPSGHGRLTPEQEGVILAVLKTMAKRRTALRVVDVVAEVGRLCNINRIPCPTRRAIDRRIKRHGINVRRRDARPAAKPATASGTHRVARPLDVVQIDHTKADILVVDNLYREPIGRPYLSVAMDVATRVVLAVIVSFDPPSANTVALCVKLICEPKAEWLRSLGLSMDWPMAGIPRSLHLDNAAEFHSKALRRGCSEFGIELIYRPPGRPHFGGHIERLIGTLMEGLKRLPGATGSSVKERKERKPEKTAQMTLAELERWLVIEIGERYHHAEHRGLEGATPHAVWTAIPPVATPAERTRSLPFAFFPAIERTVRREGVIFNHIRYWHPVFSQWAPLHKRIRLHYDARDLSKLFLRGKKGEFLEVAYADLRRPAISLWELEAARRYLRRLGRATISEERLFKAMAKQQAIITEAGRQTRTARQQRARKEESKKPKSGTAPRIPTSPQETREVVPFGGEIWVK